MEDSERCARRLRSSAALQEQELRVAFSERQNLSESFREEVRAGSSSFGERSVQTQIRREKDILELEVALQSKETAIRQLRDEIESSHRSIEQLHQNYACVRSLNERKDTTIGELHAEINLMQRALEEAQQDKIQTLDSLHSVQADLAACTIDKHWLQEQVRTSHRDTYSETRSPTSESISSLEDLLQRMEEVKRERERINV